VQRFLGDLKSAEKNLNKAIALDSGDVDAIALRSGLRTQTAADNHIAELEQSLARSNQSVRATVSIYYALAKELEDVEKPLESFQHLSKGAELRRQHINYDVGADLETMAGIQSAFDESRFFQGDTGHVDASPIFVIGMPRTGTTLVERILGSHSVVKAAGELNNFALQLTTVARAAAAAPIKSRSDLIAASARADVANLGRAYVDSCRPIAGDHAHFVDKMPMNFLYAGLIHLALPKAKIVHVVRDPMDTCYAVFKTLFEGAYPYSYNLDELAHYFVSYHRLMEHWEKMMPGIMMHIRYEDLVTDTKTGTQFLFDYCELSWERQCLNFQDAKDASTTASAAQIRQPIYQSSIGRWRQYENELQTVVQILQDAGIPVSDR